jgi:uncharacterized iron-regulated membrane protein
MQIGSSAFKRLYRLHMILGLFVALQFSALAISGVPLLFRAELAAIGTRTANDATPPARTDIQLAQGYAAGLVGVLRASSGLRPLAMFPDEQVPGVLHLRAGKAGSTRLRGAERFRLDSRTGQVLGAEPASRSRGVLDWLLELQRELFLGTYGKLYVGLIGILYCGMLATGLLIYGRFMKTRRLRDLWRLARERRARPADLHKLTGIVTFGWGLLVGLSGVLLAFNGWLIKLFQLRSLRHLSERYAGAPDTRGADLAQVIEAAFRASPGSHLEYIAFPGAEYGIAGHFLVLMDQRLLVIDGASAALSEVVELPWYIRLVRWAEPIHFANYGGLAIKVFWLIFALGSLSVVVWGVASFVGKRRKYRAPALRGEYA